MAEEKQAESLAAAEDTSETQADETVDTATPKSTEDGEQDTSEKEGEGEPSDAPDETSEETETEETAEDVEPEKDDGAKEDIDDVDAIIEGVQGKDGSQKRIDRLTAEKKALQEKLDAYESGKPKNNEVKEYTDAELKRALAKAMADDDHELVYEIMDYRAKKVERELTKKYQEERDAAQNRLKQFNTEWAHVVKSYEYLADPSQREVYSGSRMDLDIKNSTSLLYRVALKMYNGDNYYQQTPGGQRLAVADALAAILRNKRGTAGDKETATLKRSLSKERRKRSLASASGAMRPTKSKKASGPMTDAQRLDDYINDRRNTQAAGMGIEE